MNNIIKTLRSYVNNKLINHDFEKFIYNNDDLIDILGKDLYLQVISSDYTNKNDIHIIKTLINDFLDINYPKNESFIEKLKIDFPNFTVDNENLTLPYIISGDFSHYLIESYSNNQIEVLKKGLSFIENLLNSDSYSIQEIATIGFLENMQNICINNKINLEEIYLLLGKKSKVEWNKLIKFWNSDIKKRCSKIDGDHDEIRKSHS